MAYHRYRANADIPALFIEMLIYMGTSKQQAKQLTQTMFKHHFLGEIDVVLDNIDANLRIPLPQNYYMSLSNGAKVKNLVIVNSQDFESFQAIWPIISKNIEFLLKAGGLQSDFTSNWRAIFLYGEDIVVTDDLGILENGDLVDGNNWGFGLGEEWYPKDYWLPKEKAESAAHLNCGPECPIVLDVACAPVDDGSEDSH